MRPEEQQGPRCDWVPYRRRDEQGPPRGGDPRELPPPPGVPEVVRLYRGLDSTQRDLRDLVSEAFHLGVEHGRSVRGGEVRVLQGELEALRRRLGAGRGEFKKSILV